MTELYELKVPMVPGKHVDSPPLTANDRLHWRKKAELTALVRDSVAWRARNEGIGVREHVVVQLHYAPQDRRRRDASNLMPTQKAAVDGLVLAGVVPDDTAHWVTELMPVVHQPNGGARRMWLSVRPVSRSVAEEDRAEIKREVFLERTQDAASGGEG